VLGKSYDDAKALLEGDQYQFKVEKKTEVSTEPEGIVLEQNPKLGDEVEKGSTITLTVAKAEEKATVPDVSGKSCDDAKAQMQANNLTGSCTEQETQDPNQVGKVISTTPQAGSKVDKGSSVQIVVGKAPQNQQVQVPPIQGQKLKDAKKVLQDAGLNVGNINGSDDDNAVVINSNPPQGSTVNKGQTVDLFTLGGGGNNGGNNGGGTQFFGGTTG
jgi:serine/threonine-protein kinase